MSSGQRIIVDRGLSIARGIPLLEEEGLGELTLPGFLQEVTKRHGAREALVLREPGREPVRWTYTELRDQSLAVAKALVARGLGKGERVGVLMTNRPEFLAAVFGTALAGGVVVPLSTFSTSSELEYLLAASACSVLLFDSSVLKKEFKKMVEAIEPAILTSSPGALNSSNFPFLRLLVAVEGEPSGAIEAWPAFLESGRGVADAQIDVRSATVKPADPAAVFFSSGSTNRPKGVLSAHRGVAIQMWRMRGQQGLRDDVRYWTANGFFWSGNFSMALGATLAAGGSLVLQRTFEPDKALRLIEDEKVNFLFAWPHQWAQLVGSSEWGGVDLSSLQYVDVDSPIARHPTVRTDWIQPTHCYGNTETFTLSTAFPAGTTREEACDSHGVPLPGNTIKIIDPLSGEVVPIGTHGEVCVKGPTLMLGYLGVPLDESLDEQGFFRTGDGGYLDDGGRLYWEGRLNDIIKTGGANVSPLEIDEVIMTMPGVKLSQTVGIPHETLGEMVVSCIVPQLGTPLDEQTVRMFVREKLASYKVPKKVLFLESGDLRFTGSSKVKSSNLRDFVTVRLADPFS